MQIFDTHTHDYFHTFDKDRDEMLKEDFSSGVMGKVQIGCDEETSLQALKLARTDEKMWATVGIHPCYVEENFEKREKIFNIFEKLLKENPKKIIGIGETGFDFYHKDSDEMREKQKTSFIQHIQFAVKYEKPLVIHTRNARKETLDFFADEISKYKNVKAVIHCFSEDAHFAKTVTEKYGFFLGIGGVATYPACKEIRNAIDETPIKFLITETDSPYLAPQSKRGKRNQSKNIKEVIELISEIKKIPLQECSEILVKNAKQFWGV